MKPIVCAGRLVPNFSLEEMANNLTKAIIKLLLTPEVVRHALMMQVLRDWWKRPMTVNSWYREEAYNKEVGGDPHSCHLDGIATDIALPHLTEEQIKMFINKWKKICIKYGVIGGISIYHWGLHFDSNNTADRYGHVNKNFRITDFRK